MMAVDAKIPGALDRLSRSRFRAGFKLDRKDIKYIDRTGLSKIRSHAGDFVTKRLAPAKPKNDGKQTPFKGHPVFKAQHATGTCCRKCLEKWHNIPPEHELNTDEVEFIVDLIMTWICIRKDVKRDSRL